MDVNLQGSLKSMSSVKCLLQAETGDSSMVEMDSFDHGSELRSGQRITADEMAPYQPHTTVMDHESRSLARHGTLLSACTTPVRHAAELKSILGDSQARLKSSTAFAASASDAIGTMTRLEQAKRHARVEVDLALESNVCVQGGFLNGTILIRVRKRKKQASSILLAGGKMRIIGFECIHNETQRHTFYQCSSTLREISLASHCVLNGRQDHEVSSIFISLDPLLHVRFELNSVVQGFIMVEEGVHLLPFSMMIPLDSGEQIGIPKGAISLHAGVAVRYIAML
jgi:hypothetical protein